MDSALFDYPLPPERIAQEPAERRDASRLMVVDRRTGAVEHTVFAKIGDYLPADALYFRNNASVLKARLPGRRPTGGRVECLLLQPAENPLEWWCLLRPGKKTAQAGEFGLKGEYRAEVAETGSGGSYRVRFSPERNEEVVDLAERLGRLPLPPYIERSSHDPRHAADEERYQTVYANPGRRVAVASPTAGLHFTPELLHSLETGGARFYDLTLHVGPGTFRPIQTDTIDAHDIHREWYEIPPDVLRALQAPGGPPRVAVGTTVVRSVEDAFRRIAGDAPDARAPNGGIRAEADLFIRPPATFAGVDHLITNFHLPRSTLLCLVSAFLTPGETRGIEWLKELYAEAVERNYRFYSYGDAMLLL